MAIWRHTTDVFWLEVWWSFAAILPQTRSRPQSRLSIGIVSLSGGAAKKRQRRRVAALQSLTAEVRRREAKGGQPTLILLIFTRVYNWRWPFFVREFFRRRSFCTTSFGPWLTERTSAVTEADSSIGCPTFSPSSSR